uniref:Uncharacterized protein n=1 Tax=virus sp. ct6Ax4 TaxID=2826791 RepID=A0A8S5R7A6_9VIRU|nr:MAG TPA: hypothetical protein [virus sp. ct6Ax4]
MGNTTYYYTIKLCMCTARHLHPSFIVRQGMYC